MECVFAALGFNEPMYSSIPASETTTASDSSMTTAVPRVLAVGSAMESDAFIAGLSIGLIIVLVTLIGLAVWLGKMKRIKFKARKIVRPESRGSSGYDST
jgi:hypothetical protein